MCHRHLCSLIYTEVPCICFDHVDLRTVYVNCTWWLCMLADFFPTALAILTASWVHMMEFNCKCICVHIFYMQYMSCVCHTCYAISCWGHVWLNSFGKNCCISYILSCLWLFSVELCKWNTPESTVLSASNNDITGNEKMLVFCFVLFWLCMWIWLQRSGLGHIKPCSSIFREAVERDVLCWFWRWQLHGLPKVGKTLNIWCRLVPEAETSH